MKFLLLIIFVFIYFSAPAHAANVGDVVINEIAWMGTTNSYHQEWLELYNTTNSAINIEGWILRATDETPSITLGGSIPALGFFLLEKSSSAAPLVPIADKVYTGSLMVNSGEHMELTDKDGNSIDDVNAFGSWFAGDNITKQTMERKKPNVTGSDPVTWGTSISPGGTPKAQNSIHYAQESHISDPTPAPSPADESEKIAIQADTDSAPPTNIQTQASYPSNIFINELMPYPLGPDELNEWIELINESNDPADISGWQVKDTLGATNTYILDASVPPNSFVVLSRPTTKITMNNDNDAIQLVRPDGELVQTVPYENAPKGKSYVRSDGTWKWSAVPTPGSANIVPAPLKNTGTVEDIKKVTEKYDAPKQPSAPVPESVSVNQLAYIGKRTTQKQSPWLVPFIASSIALLSSLFIFLLKKRLSRY